MIRRLRRLWRREPTYEEARQARRRAVLVKPRRVFKGIEMASPFDRVKESPRYRLGFTAVVWVLGLALVCWAAGEALGPWGWKLALGLVLLASGGLEPLVVILRYGLGECPPWEWFGGSGKDDDSI